MTRPGEEGARYYVCSGCLAGFREDARAAFEELGLVSAAGVCRCGGVFEPTDADSALGPDGALDTALRRARGGLPS